MLRCHLRIERDFKECYNRPFVNHIGGAQLVPGDSFRVLITLKHRSPTALPSGPN